MSNDQSAIPPSRRKPFREWLSWYKAQFEALRMTEGSSSDREMLRNLILDELKGWQALKGKVQDRLAQVRDREERELEELAGPDLETMLKSKQDAQSYLRSVDSRLREAALRALLAHWDPCGECAAVAREMMLHDSSVNVRLAAVEYFWSYYARTNDREAGECLAGVVLDGSQQASVREEAYRGLVALRDVGFFGWPVRGLFRFPDEVDWDFVHSFLAS